MKLFAGFIAALIGLSAQEATAPLFKIQVTARTTRAVNYRVRSGSTSIDFKGTQLLLQAKGRGSVDPKSGTYAVSANFEKLVPASTFGTEYLTYVLWAVTPEGRASNMGEVVLDGDKARIQTTTELQVFGMIVTAEPYFAVTTPSNVVVLENIIRDDTYGTNMPIEAKFELFERGQYAGAGLKPPVQNTKRKVPNALYQARNAVAIAKWQGAETWAADSLKRAVQELNNAESSQAGKKPDDRRIVASSREAVQRAEDARALSVKRAEAARIAKEQADADARAAASKQQAEAEAAARAQADENRRKAEADAALAAAAQQKAEAEQERARLQAEKASLEAQQAEAKRLAAAAAEAKAREAQEKAEADQRALRQRLLAQFNAILETKDTERGLVVNMGDVLFDTGKFTLRGEAREALAKLSGIVLAYPGLHFDIEGHTDSTGSDALNQKLSEQRADSVKAYLIEQKIAPDSLVSRGFGKAMPIADNATSKGRQQNRRVEMIVSGEVIGTKLGAAKTTP